MMYHHGILKLTLSLDPEKPLADLGLIFMDDCNITVLLSCDNEDFAYWPAFLVASNMDPVAGPPTAPSLNQQLESTY